MQIYIKQVFSGEVELMLQKEKITLSDVEDAQINPL